MLMTSCQTHSVNAMSCHLLFWTQYTGWFFWLVPPRKVLSMELVPPNRKNWLSTLVPPKTQKMTEFLTNKQFLFIQCSRWKTRPGLALLWVGEFLKGGKCEIVSVLLQYIAYLNKWFGRLCWKKMVVSVSYVGPVYLVIFSCWGVPVSYFSGSGGLGWDQCTWSFFPVGGDQFHT